jgi:tetratricopeptide (TPR) repeat protein
LQSEIARRIVEAIAVRLSPDEERRLAEIPTQNLDAYEAYSRARAVFFGANYTRTQEEAAEPFLERAIELDPNYVDAQVLLSAIYAQRYWRGTDTSSTLLEKYRQTLDRASALNPASPDVLRAQANYSYRVDNDYRGSLELLERAVQAAPGNVDIHGDIAFSLRRLGRWDDAIASFRRTLELDPASSFYRALMLETMVSIWKWQDVVDNSVPLEEANPDEFDSQVCRGVALMNLTGDLEPLQRVFEHMNVAASTWYLTHSAYVHMLRRDPDGAIEVLNGPAWAELAQQQVGKRAQLAQLADAWLLKGDEARALDLYGEVVADQDVVMSSSLQTQIYGGTTIAVALARLGRRDEALALADRLVRENPYEKDAMLAATPLFRRALVKGLIGDADGAIADLQVALKMPTAVGITAWDLHYDPNWDVLRKDPRFVALATPDERKY